MKGKEATKLVESSIENASNVADEKNVLPGSTISGDQLQHSAAFRDPLKWFGTAPPSLQQAQGSFEEAVSVAIPNLVNVVREIGKIEREVKRTREKLARLVEQ